MRRGHVVVSRLYEPPVIDKVDFADLGLLLALLGVRPAFDTK